MGRGMRSVRRGVLVAAVAAPLAIAGSAAGQTPPAPSVVDPDLAVRTAVSGLTQPTSMAFIGHDDFLVVEKSTGQVKRVKDGEVRGTVLDLAVNSNSERGLLGIALDPKYKKNGFVYLFWSESRTGADSTDRRRRAAARQPRRPLRMGRRPADASTRTSSRSGRSSRTPASRCAATTTAA